VPGFESAPRSNAAGPIAGVPALDHAALETHRHQPGVRIGVGAQGRHNSQVSVCREPVGDHRRSFVKRPRLEVASIVDGQDIKRDVVQARDRVAVAAEHRPAGCSEILDRGRDRDRRERSARRQIPRQPRAPSGASSSRSGSVRLIPCRDQTHTRPAALVSSKTGKTGKRRYSLGLNASRAVSPRPRCRGRCPCRCQFLCQSACLALWVRDDPEGVVFGVLNGDRVRARFDGASGGDVVGVLAAGESSPSVCSLLAKAEEVSEDRRGGDAQQMCNGAVAAVSDWQRTELLDQSTSETVLGDGCARDRAWEQPSRAAVVKGAALRCSREPPDELVDRLREREFVATKPDAGVFVVVADAVRGSRRSSGGRCRDLG
jgi:hypothetical protein